MRPAIRRSGLELAIALCSVLFAWAVHAQTPPARMALLIGNQGYTQKVGRLKNPHNDVEIIAASLKTLGFAVTVLKDGTYKQIDTALKRYVTEVRRAGRGTISFFYYSGHGVSNPETQVNYLIPVDVADADDDKVWFESFQQNVLIDLFAKQATLATHYLVFDACRNELNVGGANAKALGTDKGFVPVADTSGLLVAYATAPKRTASDAGDGGGPYAKALAEELVRPGVEAVSMFRNVQIRVKQSIGQDPWLSFPSLPPVYLAGREAAPVAIPTPSAVAVPAAPGTGLSEAAVAWERVRRSESVAVLEAFARQFPGTVYAAEAQERIGELRRAAEQHQRVALLQKQEEDRKRAEAEAAARAAEAKRKADEEAAKRDPAFAVVAGSGKPFRDCADCPEMVVVPAGSFMMGSPDSEAGRSSDEGPQRQVTIARPFAVGRFEVTFDEWAACFAARGCQSNGSPSDQGWGKGRRPVINVSWSDAQDYAAWLSRKTGKTYRLLTESEWEYAARAGTATHWSFGDDEKLMDKHGRFSGNSGANTKEVGQYLPNAWGLHDMHGNVWEWVQDCYGSYSGARTDGSAVRDTAGCSRILRGGSFGNVSQALRSAVRFRSIPGYRSNSVIGFRLARTLNL